MRVQFVKKSSNAKIGAIPCTTSSRDTCPESCPLSGEGGCYAEAGYYTRLNWDKVDSGERGGDWQALCDSVAALPSGQVWRHNVAGDLPHKNQRIDRAKLVQLIDANEGKRGFTYTHHNMAISDNAELVRMANECGFTVNISADSPALADVYASHKLGPVVCIVPDTYARKEKAGEWAETLSEYGERIGPLPPTTPKGRRIVVCPATYLDKTCESCKLCAIPSRSVIVGFPAHGSRKNKIEVNKTEA